MLINVCFSFVCLFFIQFECAFGYFADMNQNVLHVMFFNQRTCNSDTNAIFRLNSLQITTLKLALIAWPPSLQTKW